MRLRTLELTNFRQHAATRFDFEPGITGIVGRNGAGKSTVLEAIAWALYGQAAARGAKDSIRNLRAPARAGVRVALTFDLGSHTYRVVRSLATAELYLDDSPTPMASSLSAVTDVLQRVVGMTRQEFFQTYFTGQKELQVMGAMSPAERGAFLSRVLGYDQLRVAQDSLRERRRDLTGQLAGMRTTLPDPAALALAQAAAGQALRGASDRYAAIEGQHAAAIQAEASARPLWEQAEQRHAAHATLATEIRGMERDALRLADHVRDLSLELESLAGERSVLTLLDAELVDLPRVQAERNAQESLHRAHLQREQLAGEAARLRWRAGQLGLRMAEIPVEGIDREAWAADLGDLVQRRTACLADERSARSAWTAQLQSARSERDHLRAQFRQRTAERERIVALGVDAPCPTCTRVLGEHRTLLLDAIDRELSALLLQGTTASEQVSRLEAEPEALAQLVAMAEQLNSQQVELQRHIQAAESASQERARILADVLDVDRQHDEVTARLAALPAGYDAAAHATVEREVARLTAMQERATRLRAQIERIPVVEMARVRAEADQEQLAARRATLERQMQALGHSEEGYVAARDGYRAVVDAQRAAELSLVRAQAELDAARREAASTSQAVADAARAQAAAERVGRETRLHHELDRIYSGLRTELNDQLRPELSAIASDFLATLTQGRYAELELDEQFNVVVIEDGRPKTVISGGEEDLTNLALRLAISQMIAERNGHRLNLLILDEIFGALDEQRQASVVDLLQSLGNQFEQVVLITHLPVVRGQAHEIVLDIDPSAGCTIVRKVA